MSTRARELIYCPIEHVVGFAVPNDAALGILAAHAPLVEVGAGTGYWSAVLRQRGVDIVAYDSDPPSQDLTNHFFYNFSFCEVLKGDGAKLFTEHPGLAVRTLVLIWPNNADAVDNPKHAIGPEAQGHRIWDADCLQSYLDAGGGKVVFIGERESQIAVVDAAAKDSGLNASRRFQAMLTKYFRLEKQVPIPQWLHAKDDLTVWVKQ